MAEQSSSAPKRANEHTTVKRWWPRSLALLELARVAVEIDSDLGLVVPVLTGLRARPTIEYQMSSSDMTDDQFLSRLAAFWGPKNTADLNGRSDLVLPDLSGQGFALPL